MIAHRRGALRLSSVATVVLLMVCVNDVQSSFASPHRTTLVCDGAWHLSSSEHPRAWSQYSGVAAVSPSLAWAVGRTRFRGFFRAVVERWDGAYWSIVPVQRHGRGDELLDVAAPDAGHAYAVGVTYRRGKRPLGRKPLLEQFDGTAWSDAALPHIGRHDAFLTGVAALSASDAWAVGYRTFARHEFTLMMHWNGTAWSIVPTPKVRGAHTAVLGDLAAVSSTDVWAVGYFVEAHGSTQPLTEHWDGTAWSVVPTPSPGPGSILWGVAADAHDDAWAVGETDVASEPLAERWDGSSWTIVDVQHPAEFLYLESVTASSAGVFALVARYRHRHRRPIVERWDGTSFQPMLTAREGLRHIRLAAAASDGSTVWAAGFYSHKGGFHPAAEYLC